MIKIDSIEIPEDKFKEIAEAHGYEKKEKVELKKTVPEKGDTYYVLTASGTIMSLIWLDVDVDKQTLAMGNVFLSSAEAKKEREKRLATVRVINKIAELNKGEVLDWADTGQKKYFFRYFDWGDRSAPPDSIDHSYIYLRRSLPKNRYLVREKDAEFMLETMPDDIKLMLGD